MSMFFEQFYQLQKNKQFLDLQHLRSEHAKKQTEYLLQQFWQNPSGPDPLWN